MLQVTRTEWVFLTVDLCGYFLCRSFPSLFSPTTHFLLSPHMIWSNHLSKNTTAEHTWHFFFREMCFLSFIFFSFSVPSCTCSTRCSQPAEADRAHTETWIPPVCYYGVFFSLLHPHRSPFSPCNRGLGFSDTLSLCIWQNPAADSILAWNQKTTR